VLFFSPYPLRWRLELHIFPLLERDLSPTLGRGMRTNAVVMPARLLLRENALYLPHLLSLPPAWRLVRFMKTSAPENLVERCLTSEAAFQIGMLGFLASVLPPSNPMSE